MNIVIEGEVLIVMELPCRPPCELLLLEMNLPQRVPLTLPLRVLPTHPLGNGRHFVGTRFAWELVANSKS
jgi:hypothetical protein